MNQVYKMALRYYPDRWNDTMLRNLVELGRLTKEEYKAITGEDYDNETVGNTWSPVAYPAGWQEA